MFGLPRVQVLSAADLPPLPACPDCGFRPGADPEWARAAQQRWSMVGVGVTTVRGGMTHALVGLPEHLPADHPLSGQKTEPGVAILVAANGSERLLLPALSARLVGRVHGIEAAGSRVHSSCQAPASAWLERAGFHPTPDMEWLPGGARRMRLDLDATVSWTDPWRWAARRLGRLRPRPEPAAPEGAGRLSRRY